MKTENNHEIKLLAICYLPNVKCVTACPSDCNTLYRAATISDEPLTILFCPPVKVYNNNRTSLRTICAYFRVYFIA